MGCGTSSFGPAPGYAGYAGGGYQQARQAPGFKTIRDNYTTLEQVQEALRQNGLESSQLILGFDFTKSNEWTGKYSFGGQSLHKISAQPNPYEEAASIISRTLAPFDDDNEIPVMGFGDVTTRDKSCFSFFAENRPAHGLDEAVARYRQIAPLVQLSGPTSFAPFIYEAMRVTAQSGNQFHLAVLIADGQVTRSVDTARGYMSPQEQATVQAIIDASDLPLGIIMVGVGDGPFDTMQEFDDALPQRRFDNFQFVDASAIMREMRNAPIQHREAYFALRALMEVPEQYRAVLAHGLVGAHPLPRALQIPPPMPPPAQLAAAGQAPALPSGLGQEPVLGQPVGEAYPPLQAGSYQPASLQQSQPPAATYTLEPYR